MARTEILIEDSILEYELNEEDILEYAKQIGIDVKNEKHLMWIAEEGLSANVPEPWLILSDPKGRIFFSNIETAEKSWLHPLDREYSALVLKERRKHLRSRFSENKLGSESPLNSIHDGSLSPGRFPKAPLPQLSSLSDAPPLSLSGKNTPTSLKNAKSSITISEKKLDLGHFENRRGTKLAPVKLNNLKMPVQSTSQKSSSSMSFMPKGSSLSRNIRRGVNEEQDHSRSQFSGRTQMNLPEDDLPESMNSDDGSKYSYEETDDDIEKSYDDMNPSDIGSHFSPPPSAIDSPEAVDINSLVQLGSKLPPRLESAKKTMPQLQPLTEEQSPSLSLRKSGQPSFLKPLQQTSKKKITPKASKKPKIAITLNSKYDQDETEEDLDYKISVLNEEQRLRFESIQKEWVAMHEELERDEKEKYNKMVKESGKKFEEEETLLRTEGMDKLSKLKKELSMKIEEEENSSRINLAEIKKANEQKYIEEEENFKKKLKSLSETMKIEVEKIEQKNEQEVSEKKKLMEDEIQKELEEIKNSQQINVKKVEDTHAAEIALLEESHKEKIKNLQNSFTQEENEATVMVKVDEPPNTNELNGELQKLEELLKKEQERYEQLQRELNDLQTGIESKQDLLTKLEEKTATAQTFYEDIQDEADKTENDLDLLRTEKSALISELNILKENVNNEKSNLLKEKKLDIPPYKKCDIQHKGVNTYASSSVICQASQTCIESKDISCQITEIESSKADKYSQTTSERRPGTSDISCQVDLLQHTSVTLIKNTKKDNNVNTSTNDTSSTGDNFTNTSMPNNTNIDGFVNKVLENALIGISNKMEARFKSIEEKIGSLDKNLDTPSNNHPDLDVFDTLNSIHPTEVKSISHVSHQNGHTALMNNRMLPGDTVHINAALSNKKKCSCERGDAGSCEVMQDVKSSIYRLNDILSTSFVPSLGNTVISGFAYPPVNYSSPLESFYTQFRQLQEKYRVTELKHKLLNESRKEPANLLKVTGTNHIRDLIGTEPLTLNRALNSSAYSGNVPDDPVSRARNLVLREQARSWKQQKQYLNSSDMQGFLPLERNYNLSISDNISQSPSRVSSAVSESSPNFQYPFLKFEPDPESEYNEWMSRLKTLQDKIRSHKLL